jgi:hypothetical protein
MHPTIETMTRSVRIEADTAQLDGDLEKPPCTLRRRSRTKASALGPAPPAAAVATPTAATALVTARAALALAARQRLAGRMRHRTDRRKGERDKRERRGEE